MERLNVCLIGAGRMGAIRAQILYANPHVNLLCIVASEQSREDLAAKYHTQFFATMEELYTAAENPSDHRLRDIHAFVLSASTSAHYELITSICKSQFVRNFSEGKEWFNRLCIFSEKPIDADPGRITEIFKTCENANVALCCGFQRRFDASYIAMKNKIESGAIGKPLFARVFFADHPTPRLEFLLNDGCPFMDLSPHDVDFVRWCLTSYNKDDKPETVAATGSSTLEELKKHNVLDSVMLDLKFTSGCLVNMYFSRSSSYGYDQRVEIFGTKGKVSVENELENTMLMCDEKGMVSPMLKYSFPQRFKEAFENEINTFVDVCYGNTTWPVSMEDCVETQRIASLAAEANKMGKILQYPKSR